MKLDGVMALVLYDPNSLIASIWCKLLLLLLVIIIRTWTVILENENYD